MQMRLWLNSGRKAPSVLMLPRTAIQLVRHKSKDHHHRPVPQHADQHRGLAMFNGQFIRKDGPESIDSKTNQILYINASHRDTSLVGQASKELLTNLNFKFTLKLISYNVSHVAAKMRLMKGKGTPEDEELFRPILEMAEELNSSKIMIISSPMWNFSFPYVLKQYVDIVIQPGINFLEHPERPVTSNKILILITSSGGAYGETNPRDYLNKYLEEIFDIVGFERSYSIKIQGAANEPREMLENYAKGRAADIAQMLNDLFIDGEDK